MLNFKIGFNFVIQIFKSWLYLINQFLHSTTKGLKGRDLIKKLIIIIKPDLNSVYPYTPCRKTPALPLKFCFYSH